MREEFVEHLEAFSKDHISRYHVEIRRGDTHFLASQFIDYYLPLTLPCVSYMKENLEQKMLYCLLNLAVDDCIDNGGDAQYLIKDLLKVLSRFSGEKKVKPQTAAGKLMNKLVKKILSTETCNSDIGHTFFFLDAVGQVKGFTYDNIIHKRNSLASLSEYEEHVAITKDMRICLDIDICTTKGELLLPGTINKLREAFKFFGLALTYQGDIATFESEFFEEKSLNSVVILGQETAVLPPHVLDLSYSEKDEIFKRVIPNLFDEIRKYAIRYRDVALERLKEVREVDTSSLEQVFCYFVDNKFPGTEMERTPTTVK